MGNAGGEVMRINHFKDNGETMSPIVTAKRSISIMPDRDNAALSMTVKKRMPTITCPRCACIITVHASTGKPIDYRGGNKWDSA